METRCLIRYRSVLHFLVLVLGAWVVLTNGQGQARAQSPESTNTRQPSGSKGKNAPPPVETSQEAVPADHFDPDDQKTYDDVVSEDRAVAIRGRRLLLHLYRPKASGRALPALYACGDGGWRGLAPRTAQQLAHLGLAVIGIDSKVYLRELSSAQEPLTIPQLAEDYTTMAQVAREYAQAEKTEPVYVYGWSVGAGFAVAVGSDANTRSNWAGIIAIGLPQQNQLVSGVGGNYVDLKVGANARYGFRTERVIGGISPLPVMIIESTTDTASPQKVGKLLFAAARDPKQYVLIKANNHRFSGAREEFYAALGGALTWIRQTHASGADTQTAAGQNTGNSGASRPEGRP
jgi:dienelactone hydrolase